MKQPVHNDDGQVRFVRTSEASEAKSLLVDWDKGETVGISTSRSTLHAAKISQRSM